MTISRLYSTFTHDIRLQYRNGFYYATLFVLGILALGALNMPALDLRWLLPVILFNSLLVNTFYFVAGLVLLEKAEGSLEALVITPLRRGEYLTSKVLTLTGLALLEGLVMTALFTGLGFAPLPLVAGLLFSSCLLILAGFISVARYTSINEYLLPSVFFAGLCGLPLFAYLAGWQHPLLYLHPMQASLLLLQGAFHPLTIPEWLYAIIYSLAWLALLYFVCLRAFDRHIIARYGAD